MNREIFHFENDSDEAHRTKLYQNDKVRVALWTICYVKNQLKLKGQTWILPSISISLKKSLIN